MTAKTAVKHTPGAMDGRQPPAVVISALSAEDWDEIQSIVDGAAMGLDWSGHSDEDRLKSEAGAVSLMEAAPDLLEAAKAVMVGMVKAGYLCNGTAWAGLRAAIAKAEGVR